MKKTSMGRIILFFALGLSACGIFQRRQDRPRTLSYAMSLKGMRKKLIAEKMGSEPVDTTTSGEIYYLLSEESDNHPSPSPVLYRFIFKDDYLVGVQRDEDGKGKTK